MRITIFIDWFYPAYKAGGPIKSVYNIIHALKEEHEFLVICSNRDLDNTCLDVSNNVPIEDEGFSVIYLSKDQENRKLYKDLIASFNPDIIYLNSVFSFAYSILPLLLFYRKHKIVLAPRGMLSAGALSLKPTKKRLFLKLLKGFKIDQKIIWHASTEFEQIEILDIFGPKSKVQIAQNISSPIPNDRLQLAKTSSQLKLCFISRISKKKNLKFFMDVLEGTHIDASLELDIYGPIEDQVYWQSCQSSPAFHKYASYKGLLEPTKISKTLMNYHFFILPSLNENYGHVIAEAINAGVPVIISDQTPWQNLEQAGVGYSLSLRDISEWIKTIMQCFEMEDEFYKAYQERCFEFSEKYLTSKSILEQNRALFK